MDSARTGSALKPDQYHAFNNIIDNYSRFARKTSLGNADLYQVEGSPNGVLGRFEWIIQDGKVIRSGREINGGTNKEMTKLKEFIDLKFKISWVLIDIGFQGSDIFRGELTSEDIIEYAGSFLNETVIVPGVLELATTDYGDSDSVNKIVKNLASKEDSVNHSIEMRKWVVAYVKKHLAQKRKDCIEGLSALNDIWLKIGTVENCPHIFQGVGNGISPEDYYTDQNYSKLYDAHVAWLKEEIDFLQRG